MMPWPELAIHLVTNMGVYPRSLSRLDEAWDSLRNRPRFHKLVEAGK